MNIRRINQRFSVSPQIQSSDIAAIKAAGFVAIINNRPDTEEPDQPPGAEMEAATIAAGLGYSAIPLGRDGVSDELVQRTRAVLDRYTGPVLAFCRSGTRSTTLWALSSAGKAPAGEIIAAAQAAGYDISHLAGHLGQQSR